MRKLSGLFSLLFVLASCANEGFLELEFDNEINDHFIECYLEPGALPNLSVSRIKTLDDDFILDYVEGYQVMINDEELTYGFYQLPSGHVCNYGSQAIFQPAIGDEVFLQVISEEGDTIRAQTTVPTPISNLRAEYAHASIVVSFAAASNPKHNYYIVLLRKVFEKKEEQCLAELYDFSKLGDQEYVSFTLTLKRELALGYKIIVKRITQENYQYQKSLWNARKANEDNIVYPYPLDGNIHNAEGVFTCYTIDSAFVKVPQKK
ncbi:MAG: DUF4249 family protein [Bacteroidales bacterium]